MEARAPSLPQLLLRARTRPFFCPCRDALWRAAGSKRGSAGSGPAGWGPPSIPAPPAAAPGGVAGRGSRGRTGARRARVELTAAPSSQCGPRFPASRVLSAPAVPCRPRMAAAALTRPGSRPGPRPLPLLLLPLLLLLLLRVGPVRADSKVCAPLRSGHRSVEAEREGLWLGLQTRHCVGPGTEDQDRRDRPRA